VHAFDGGGEIAAVESRVTLADALDQLAQRWSIGT
jgi:hypothetical protein